LDKFIQIIDKNDLQPEDIEKVVVTPHPIVQFKLWQQNKLSTTEDFSFYAPFLLGCAAFKIKKAHWLDEDVRGDPRIQEFMHRIAFEVIIDEKGFALPRLEDLDRRPMAVDVVANGKTFKEKAIYLKGSWQPKEYRNTDGELIEKFSDNTSKVLSSDKIKKASQAILELEKLKSINEIMELISP